MSDYQVWNELGNVYILSGELESAVNAYKKALNLNPHSGWAHHNLALAYVRLAEPEKAIEHYQRSIELLDGFAAKAEAWHRLGSAYEMLGDIKNTLLAFKRSTELAPEKNEYHTSLASVLEKLPGDVQEADGAEFALQAQLELEATQMAVRSVSSIPDSVKKNLIPVVGDEKVDLDQGVEELMAELSQTLTQEAAGYADGSDTPKWLSFENEGNVDLADEKEVPGEDAEEADLDNDEELDDEEEFDEDEEADLDDDEELDDEEEEFDEDEEADLDDDEELDDEEEEFDEDEEVDFDDDEELDDEEEFDEDEEDDFDDDEELDDEEEEFDEDEEDDFDDDEELDDEEEEFDEDEEDDDFDDDEELDEDEEDDDFVDLSHSDPEPTANSLKKNGVEDAMRNATVWGEMGNLFFSSDVFDGAVIAYKKALELDGEYGTVMHNLALLHVQRGEYEKAVELYKKSLDLLEDDVAKVVSWNNLGNAYRAMHDYESAGEAYRNADEFDVEKTALESWKCQGLLSAKRV